MKFILVSLLCLVFIIIGLVLRIKFQEYEIQIQKLSSELSKSERKINGLEYDLKKINTYYSSCQYDEMISDTKNDKFVPKLSDATGLYSSLLATQSGSMREWRYRDQTLIEYIGNILPDNKLYIQFYIQKTELPITSYFCDASQIDGNYSVCKVKSVLLSDFKKNGLTKKGYRYYQKKNNEAINSEIVTLILLPKIDSGYRSVLLTYYGKITDSQYVQYQSLIDELSVK